jgi:hypothetical protein
MNERYLYTFELALEMPQHFMFRPKIACSTRLTRAACSPIVRDSGCLAVDNLSALKRWKRHSRPRNVREPPTGDRHSQPATRFPTRSGDTMCGMARKNGDSLSESRQSQSADPRSEHDQTRSYYVRADARSDYQDMPAGRQCEGRQSEWAGLIISLGSGRLLPNARVRGVLPTD